MDSTYSPRIVLDRTSGIPLYEQIAQPIERDILSGALPAGAMIEDVEVAAAQVKRMVTEGLVRSRTGVDVLVTADTLCIHGDRPGAAARSSAIRRGLEGAGVDVRPFDVESP